MAATIVITCPECKKQLRGPAEAQGKRISCKSCGHKFVVKGTPIAEDEAAKAAKQAAAAKKQADPSDSVTDRSYEFVEEKHESVYRCPQCAFELESEESVICLNCGYNQLTRVRYHMVKTYRATFMDWSIWLAPGILSALVTLSCLGGIAFLWIGLWRREEGWVFATQIWGSVIAAFIGYGCARFAIRRLIFNFKPPEIVKHH